MKLFGLIIAKKNKIVISDLLIRELEMNYSIAEINGMMKLFEKHIEKVIVKKEQRDEAIKIAEKRNIPKGDVLHAIIARDYGLNMITRDNHFKELLDITKYHKPEDLI